MLQEFSLVAVISRQGAARYFGILLGTQNASRIRTKPFQSGVREPYIGRWAGVRRGGMVHLGFLRKALR
jgi:hypothetical protein